MKLQLTHVLLACATAALSLPAAAQVPNPLRVAAYPPFSQLGTDGQLKGFDIDIANAVCERLKTRCQFVQTEFDAMIPALRAKKFDLIVASMSITPERQKVVDFSNKYYNTPARVVTRADAGFGGTAEGLKGKKLGVQRTTIHDRYAAPCSRSPKSCAMPSRTRSSWT